MIRKENLSLVAAKDILNLTLPRYIPLVLKGATLAGWYDSHKEQYLVLCPNCRELITYDTFGVFYRDLVLSEKKCCQSCRARISFEQDPGLIGIFLDFWSRTGIFPESESWLDAIPEQKSIFCAKAIGTDREAGRR